MCGKRFTASSNLYYHRMTHNKVEWIVIILPQTLIHVQHKLILIMKKNRCRCVWMELLAKITVAKSIFIDKIVMIFGGKKLRNSGIGFASMLWTWRCNLRHHNQLYFKPDFFRTNLTSAVCVLNLFRLRATSKLTGTYRVSQKRRPFLKNQKIFLIYSVMIRKVK